MTQFHHADDLQNYSITVTRETILKNIPSASGIEFIDGSLYLSGDDSPTLFKLDPNTYSVQKTFAIHKDHGSKRNIEKPVKPDFEAMTSFIKNGKEQIMILGSGGIEGYREELVLFDLQKTDTIKRSVQSFYKEIIKQKNIPRAALNIEAAMVHQEDLYLFNRGINFIIKTKLQDLISASGSEKSPAFRIFDVNLPVHGKVRAGFSGACLINNEYFAFTATLEDTENFILDGTVMGSYIGLTRFEDLKNGMTVSPKPLTVKGTTLLQKLESIALKKAEHSSLELYAVSDNDNGSSGLFELRIEFR